jgi:hypothetical protein
VTVNAPQLSAPTTSPARSGRLAWQLASVNKVRSVAHELMLGAVVSFTVNVLTQFVVLPAASDTVSVIAVTPSATAVPAAGTCVTVLTPQLSVATTSSRMSGTIAWQSGPADSTRFRAQATITGGVVSFTVMVAVQFVVLPAMSETLNKTGVEPMPIVLPAAGT